MIYDVDELNLKSKLTPYLYYQVKDRINNLPDHLKHKLIQDSILLSEVGINSADEHKDYFYITMYVPYIVRKLLNKNLTDEKYHILFKNIYDNIGTYPIDSIENLTSATSKALSEMNIIKKAYPNTGDYIISDYPYDIQKWVKTFGDIYLYINKGYSFNDSFDYVTTNWDDMEKTDFKNWTKFYTEQAHNKYKTAKISNAFYATVPNTPLDAIKAALPTNNTYNQQQVNPIQQSNSQDESIRAQENLLKEQEIDKKIKAIIGRLNSAEKLSTEPEVKKALQKYLDVSFASWLEELQKIKRLIQVAPIKNAQSTLLEDLIVKQANILNYNGYPRTSFLMRKLAQVAPEPPPIPTSNNAMPIVPAPPVDTFGDAEPSEGNSEEDGKKAINEFIAGMNNKFDDNDSDDDFLESKSNNHFASIIVTAQDAAPALSASPPPTAPPTPLTSPISKPMGAATRSAAPPNNTNSEHEISNNPASYDAIFEKALANVSVSDIIFSLEGVANIFRTREISRKLSMIDLMMDQKGIASFFPGLAETSSKILEGNQYALTRIEDILSKLRGSMDVPSQHQVNLTSDNEIPEIPQDIPIDEVKNNLADQQQSEQNRKDLRKQKEIEKADSQLNQQQSPEGLDQPVSIEQAAPVRVKNTPAPPVSQPIPQV